jgi:hypothetical protein
MTEEQKIKLLLQIVEQQGQLIDMNWAIVRMLTEPGKDDDDGVLIATIQ